MSGNKPINRIDPTSPDYCYRCDYNGHGCGGCGELLEHDEYTCENCREEYGD